MRSSGLVAQKQDGESQPQASPCCSISPVWHSSAPANETSLVLPPGTAGGCLGSHSLPHHSSCGASSGSWAGSLAHLLCPKISLSMVGSCVAEVYMRSPLRVLSDPTPSQVFCPSFPRSINLTRSSSEGWFWGILAAPGWSMYLCKSLPRCVIGPISHPWIRNEKRDDIYELHLQAFYC